MSLSTISVTGKHEGQILLNLLNLQNKRYGTFVTN